jgi:DNA-directed RNA polymerase specialized sigma24 family protein
MTTDSTPNADSFPEHIDIAALHADCPIAWRQAYDPLFATARAAANWRLQDWHEAENAAAITVVLFLRSRPAVASFSEAKAWCAHVAARQAVSTFRKLKAAKRGGLCTVSLHDLSAHDSPVHVPHDRLRALMHVYEVTRHLSETEREMMMARFFDDESSQEIATRHGLADSSVRGVIAQSLRKLRRLNDGLPGPASTLLLVIAIMRLKAWLAPAFAIPF